MKRIPGRRKIRCKDTQVGGRGPSVFEEQQGGQDVCRGVSKAGRRRGTQRANGWVVLAHLGH